jgi:large subunit ribosomal protein L15
MANAQKTISLTTLKPAKGAKKNKLRVGRGRASGAGKTCNRGHNGEGQRSGRSRKRGFEGGQMPLFRRLPQIDGFELINPYRWLELNVKDLADFLTPQESALTYELLAERGFYNPHRFDGIRILGNGDISRKITVEAHHVTPGARKKIEAAGGSIKILAAAEAK